MTHPAAVDEEALLAECELQFVRRSGPGGQHRNKTETAVVFRHIPTAITAEANERRSQADNRRLAFFRLRLRLAVEVRHAYPTADAPSRLWLSRIVNERLLLSSEHADYPSLLAEALDCLDTHEQRLDATSDHLRITKSQLTKLFKQHRPALDRVNSARADRGLTPLR